MCVNKNKDVPKDSTITKHYLEHLGGKFSLREFGGYSDPTVEVYRNGSVRVGCFVVSRLALKKLYYESTAYMDLGDKKVLQ